MSWGFPSYETRFAGAVAPWLGPISQCGYDSEAGPRKSCGSLDSFAWLFLAHAHFRLLAVRLCQRAAVESKVYVTFASSRPPVHTSTPEANPANLTWNRKRFRTL